MVTAIKRPVIPIPAADESSLNKMFKKILCVFALCQFSNLAFGGSQDNAFSTPKIDVLKIDFFTGASHSLGSLTLSANLDSKNEVTSFRADISAFQTYSYNGTLSELRQAPQAIKVSGLTLGTLDGTGLNQNSEGKLRFTPQSWLLGSSDVPASIEITLRRLGPERKLVSLYRGGFLKSATAHVSSDPYTMNSFQLLFSPPKITKLDVQNMSCDGQLLSTALLYYRDPKMLKQGSCNFSALTPAAKLQTFADFLYDKNLNVHRLTDKTPMAISKVEASLDQAVETLNKLGLDLSSNGLSRLSKTDQATTGAVFDIYKNLVADGQLKMLASLLSAGLPPGDADANQAILDESILHLVEWNYSTSNFERNERGEEIMRLLANTLGEPKASSACFQISNGGRAAFIPEIFDVFEYVQTGDPQKLTQLFLVRLLETMISDKLNLKSPDMEKYDNWVALTCLGEFPGLFPDDSTEPGVKDRMTKEWIAAGGK